MNTQPDQTLFLPLTRSMRLRIEATIEQLMSLLDEFDGDPDLEGGGDTEAYGDELEDDERHLPA